MCLLEKDVIVGALFLILEVSSIFGRINVQQLWPEHEVRQEPSCSEAGVSRAVWTELCDGQKCSGPGQNTPCSVRAADGGEQSDNEGSDLKMKNPGDINVTIKTLEPPSTKRHLNLHLLVLKHSTQG